MILYVTDRGQCMWGTVIRQSGSLFRTNSVEIPTECRVVRKELYRAGELVKVEEKDFVIYPSRRPMYMRIPQ